MLNKHSVHLVLLFYLRNHAGRERWTAALPSRADVGMCLSPCATRLGVPTGNGILYSLSTADGSTVSQLDCGTEVRAPPVTDPWQGLWWVVTHGRELLVVEPHSLAVAARWVKGLHRLALFFPEWVLGCVVHWHVQPPPPSKKPQVGTCKLYALHGDCMQL